MIAASTPSKRGNQLVPFSCNKQYAASRHPLPFKSRHYSLAAWRGKWEEGDWQIHLKTTSGRTSEQEKKKREWQLIGKFTMASCYSNSCSEGCCPCYVVLLTFCFLAHTQYLAACVFLCYQKEQEERKMVFWQVLVCIRAALPLPTPG